jgi:hypothetical protein
MVITIDDMFLFASNVSKFVPDFRRDRDHHHLPVSASVTRLLLPVVDQELSPFGLVCLKIFVWLLMEPKNGKEDY